MAKKITTYKYKFLGDEVRIFPTVLDKNSNILVANPNDIVELLEPTQHVLLEVYTDNIDANKDLEKVVEPQEPTEQVKGE